MDDDFEKWRRQVEKENHSFAFELVIYAWIAVILITILMELL